MKKIHEIDIKIEGLAFEVFKQEMENHGDSRKGQEKSEEISKLSK